jgi:hypothetical protein
MDFEFAAIRSTALQSERSRGFMLWKRQRAAMTCSISLSFRFAARYLIIYFIVTGRGARSVTNNGD